MTSQNSTATLATARFSALLAVSVCLGFLQPVLAEESPPPDAIVPMLELEPQLDKEEAPTHPSSSQQPLKAKAVMVDINSNDFQYDQDRDVYVATGSVHVVISEQNSELFADKVTYDQNLDLLIAEGRVIIYKNGQKTQGSYAKIDLTRESALINDIETKVEAIRVQAKDALVNSKYLEFENGKFIVSQAMIAQLAGNQPNTKHKKNAPYEPNKLDSLANLAYSNQLNTSTYESDSVTLEPQVMPTSEPERKELFNWKVKEMEVHRWDDGYNKIDMNWPSLHMGKFKIATLPNIQFSYDENTGDSQYLGPDIGYDPDYGGLYYGPGWDFRMGKGSFRFSPLISYGGAGRRAMNNSRYESQGVGPGIGAIAHYRSPSTYLDFGYNSRVGQPVLLGEKKLFQGGKTRLRASINEDYNSGFMDNERPGYGLALTDTRTLAQFGKFELRSYESIGYYKDEFFPLNQREFFVEPEDGATPGTAGRLQLQARVQNTQPLLSVGKPGLALVNFGFRGDVALSGYTTGDVASVVRGGPSMNVMLGNRFQTQLQYYYANFAGETPFVFDSYYRGRQNVQMQNAFRINDFLTVGTQNSISLLRDNARDSLFTDNALFMLVGPKTMKLNIAYDVVRKRAYFGVNFFPGNGDSKAIDFERLKIFQPENYRTGIAP